MKSNDKCFYCNLKDRKKGYKACKECFDYALTNEFHDLFDKIINRIEKLEEESKINFEVHKIFMRRIERIEKLEQKESL